MLRFYQRKEGCYNFLMPYNVAQGTSDHRFSPPDEPVSKA